MAKPSAKPSTKPSTSHRLVIGQPSAGDRLEQSASRSVISLQPTDIGYDYSRLRSAITVTVAIPNQHETFTDLWNFCLEKIGEEPKILFDSDKFLNLKSPLLDLLLKRDGLNMEEIEIWKSLLKWCFNQQNMENDPTK